MSTTETHRSAGSARAAETRADVLADRRLERQGRRLGHSAAWFLAIALLGSSAVARWSARRKPFV